MEWKKPKNTSKYYWTEHVQGKMHYYGLSEQKILGVIRSPKRIETGIAENTVAVMIPVGNVKKSKVKSNWRPSFASDEASEGQGKWSQEIWVLYQIKGQANSSKGQEIKNLKNLNQEKTKKLMKLMPKKLVIISAWRYPGVSPQKNPIPEEIMREIEEMGIIK